MQLPFRIPLAYLLSGLAFVLGCSLVRAQSPGPSEESNSAATPRPLRQILIAASPETALKLEALPGDQFVVLNGILATLDLKDLTSKLIGARGRPIDMQLLNAVVQVVDIYLRQHGFPVIEGVTIPTPQSISSGVVRLSVGLGKFREIKFVGNRWFSESLLKGSLHVERGEIIRFADLDKAIAWTNDSNPFRRIQARVDAVPNTGQADLIVGVQERLPLRLVANVDNAGNDALGRFHYAAAATYANVWGLDHQITGQYITTSQPKYFNGYVLSYRAPLPWRHFVQLNTTYMRARPELFGGAINQDAENISSELRYTVPLGGGNNSAEWFAALTYKESNNDLQFGGTSVQNSKTDIFQLTSGASKVWRDARGAWLLGLNLTYSPGGINSRNTDTAFISARGGTQANYLYGTASFQRFLTLERGWEFTSRGTVQASTRGLQSSEQLNVGGASTVRGFNEAVFIGDEGFVFSNDLMLPAIRQTLPFTAKSTTRPPLDLRLLAFYDVGNVRNKRKLAFDPNFTPLASTGIGVRANWTNNLSMSFDYGWQITHLPYVHDDHGRGHLKVSLAY